MENRDLIVYCDRASQSARKLATVLGCRRWYETSTPGRKTSPVVPVVINWGASDPPLWIRREHWPWPNAVRFHLLNSVEAVSRAINKLNTLEALTKAAVPTLDFTSDAASTAAWLAKDGRYIARRTLTGNSGAGLVLVDSAERQVPAPLYTRYYPKTHEFRIHVWKGEVIDFTQKRLEKGRTERSVVRSHENGWNHAHALEEFVNGTRGNIEEGARVAVAALGLDFGAVDVLARYSTRRGRPLKDFRVCEINTGPGLENSRTIAAYTDAIDRYYQSIKHRAVIRPEITNG